MIKKECQSVVKKRSVIVSTLVTIFKVELTVFYLIE